MRALVILVSTLIVLVREGSARLDAETRCAVKSLALQCSEQILPSCVRKDATGCTKELNHVAKNLDIASCSLGSITSPSFPPTTPIARAVSTVFVNAVTGNDDSRDGSAQNPVRTVSEALERVRKLGQGAKRIFLQSGTHRLNKPIVLTAQDSNLTIQGNGPDSILSGAALLDNLAWQSTSNPNIVMADLPKELVSRLGPLSVVSYRNGEPLTRARFPNIPNFASHGFASPKLITKWKSSMREAVGPVSNLTDIIIAERKGFRYRRFQSAVGGRCARTFPQGGYFCHPSPESDGQCVYSIPTTVSLSSAAVTSMKWTPNVTASTSTAYFTTFHYLKWGGWTFQAVPVRTSPTETTLQFTDGGFQEARGDCGMGGADWFMENVLELLDSPGEYHVDLERRKLYLYHLPGRSGDALQISTYLPRLIEVIGDASRPVQGLRILNLGFEYSYQTHMEPHETPSGGDWSVHRGGTVYLEGVREVIVADCNFQYLGANGIFVSKYARGVVVERNTFYGLDGTAVLLVGDSKLQTPRPWDRRYDEDYVSHVQINNNLMSHLGLRELQGGGIFISIAKAVTIEGNVIFNGPRAGITMNDLFGGGVHTFRNVMFNLVQLTFDHGPYMVWDRQQWTLNETSQMNVFEGNLVIGTINGAKLVNNDDGARNHVIRSNVLAFGFPKFKGFNHMAINNTIIAATSFLASYASLDQATCLLVTNGDLAAPKFVWQYNTCFAVDPKRKSVAYYSVDSKNKYCSKNMFDTKRNDYYKVVFKQFGGCPKGLAKWQQQFSQESGSRFITKSFDAAFIKQQSMKTLEGMFNFA